MNYFAELSVSLSAEFFRYFFLPVWTEEIKSSKIIKLKAYQISLLYLESRMLLQYQNEAMIKRTYKKAKWSFSNIQLSCILVIHISTYSPVIYKSADL